MKNLLTLLFTVSAITLFSCQDASEDVFNELSEISTESIVLADLDREMTNPADIDVEAD